MHVIIATIKYIIILLLKEGNGSKVTEQHLKTLTLNAEIVKKLNVKNKKI